MQNIVAGPEGDLCCQLTKACAQPTTTAPALSPIPNIFEVSRESIKFIEPIGQGSFGEVWRGMPYIAASSLTDVSKGTDIN